MVTASRSDAVASGAEFLRVLVVEDEHELRELVRLTVVDQDYLVDFAHDGETAFERFRDISPHLVLLDIGLPGAFGGLDLCNAFGKERTGPFPVILMLTSNDDARTIRTARLQGANGYLVKPVSPTQLLGLLDTFDAWRLSSKRPIPEFWPSKHGGF